MSSTTVFFIFSNFIRFFRKRFQILEFSIIYITKFPERALASSSEYCILSNFFDNQVYFKNISQIFFSVNKFKSPCFPSVGYFHYKLMIVRHHKINHLS